MFYGDTIQDTRQFFFISWQKYKQNQWLQAVEKQVVDVILDHPEYQSLFESPEIYLHKEFSPELGDANPFLHMGLHMGVREQISNNRPVGIASIYTKLLQKHSDPLIVEHLIMEALAECLWQAQRWNKEFNEENYHELLAKL